MTKLTHRSIALITPGLIEILITLIFAYATRNKTNGVGGVEFGLMLVGAMVLSVVLLHWAPFNRFWKTYLFALASALLPWLIAILVITAMQGTGGYWLLGIISLSFIIIITAIISLPVTWYFWWILRNIEPEKYE